MCHVCGDGESIHHSILAHLCKCCISPLLAHLAQHSASVGVCWNIKYCTVCMCHVCGDGERPSHGILSETALGIAYSDCIHLHVVYHGSSNPLSITEFTGRNNTDFFCDKQKGRSLI